MIKVIRSAICKLFGREPEVSNEDRIRKVLSFDADMAAHFANFTMEAVNRGFEAKLTIEVDGIMCECGLLLQANEPLMEYIANWACREKILKAMRLDEFDRGEGMDRRFDELWTRCIQEEEIMRQGGRKLGDMSDGSASGLNSGDVKNGRVGEG